MSHFTVLIPAEDEDELHRRLAPYYEQYAPDDVEARDNGWIVFKSVKDSDDDWYDYENDTTTRFKLADGTLDDPYQEKYKVVVKDLDSPFPQTKYLPPDDAEEVEVPVKEVLTEDEYFGDYHGLNRYHGEWGYWHNPRAEWDWWVVGGRWTGTMPLMMNGQRPESAMDGEPGVFGRVNDDESRADTALVKDIDFDQWAGNDHEYHSRRWDRLHAALDQVADLETLEEVYEVWYRYGKKRWEGIEYDPDKWITETMERYNDPDRQEGIKKCWPTQMDYFRFQAAQRICEVEHDMHMFMISYDEIHNLLQPREVYLSDKKRLAQTFAFIDLDGNWVERADMGFWAMTGPENEGYDEAWWGFVKSLPDDQRLYVVDCHI